MRLALIVANSKYEDPTLSKLTAPAADALALGELLRDTQIGGFDDVQILQDIPYFQVQRAIADFFADKLPDDLLLFYFSGHGLLDLQGRLYLGVQDTLCNRLSVTSLSSSFIKDEMENSLSKRQVLIMDCCYSGAFERGTKGQIGKLAIHEATFGGRGRIVLTASDKTQYAWEGNRVIGETKNSLYTHYMIEGLKSGSADLNGDGQITPDELYEYIYTKIIVATPNQKPRKIVYDQQGEIVIARNPHAHQRSSGTGNIYTDKIFRSANETGIVSIFPTRYGKFDGTSVIDAISQEMLVERSQIRLVGISLGDYFLDRGVLHSSFMKLLEALGNQATKPLIRALLVHPKSETLRERARWESGSEYFQEPAFFDSTTFIETDGAVRIAKRLCEKYGAILEVRLYRQAPTAFVLLTSRFAFIEAYNYAGRGSNVPIFQVQADASLYRYYESHFERIWSVSEPISAYNPHGSLEKR